MSAFSLHTRFGVDAWLSGAAFPETEGGLGPRVLGITLGLEFSVCTG